MSAHPSLFPLAATAVTGFALATAILIVPDLAGATEQKAPASKPKITQQQKQQPAPSPAAKAGTTTANRTPASPPAAPATPAAPTGPAAPEQRGAACTCPGENRTSPWPRPKYADLKHDLDEGDEIAALESLQLALSEVGDGSTYVWHRRNGRLSGVVQPTISFRDSSGKVCRHVQFMLTSGPVSKKTEGIACRLENGQWQLEG